jgi:hypothetical protein
MTNEQEAWVIHDGVLILETSPRFCELFRCETEDTNDWKIESIIAGEDYRALARWRGKHIMQTAENRAFKQEYDFLRFDGTVFRGESTSQRQPDGRYLTSIRWMYEVH